MEVEKLKLYLDFGKFFLGTFLIGLITFLVKSGFEDREIAIKESDQIGKYIEIALREDIGVRKRFAEYFKTVTISHKYRTRWETYYELVKEEFEAVEMESVLVEKKIDSLKQLNDNLKIDNDSIRENLLYNIGELTKEKAALAAELEVKSERNIINAYQFVLNSLHPDPEIKEAIISYLEDKNFKYMGGTNHDYRKSWMADTSTIFYYSNKSRFIAKKIASDLAEITGIKFNIQQRTELSIQNGRAEDNFLIHYIH